GVALVLPRHRPRDGLGGADGRVVADRDSGGDLLPARAAADHVRAHGRRRQGMIAAGLLLPSFAGPEPPDWARRFLAEGGAGLTLFAGNVAGREQLSEMAASLRAEKEDALLAIDEEGGDV